VCNPLLQCDATNCIYLVDFGFAVASDASLASRGVSTCKDVGFQGTPIYSAPETFAAVPQVTHDAEAPISDFIGGLHFF
jgi:serine/threonine protein kinase